MFIVYNYIVIVVAALVVVVAVVLAAHVVAVAVVADSSENMSLLFSFIFALCCAPAFPKPDPASGTWSLCVFLNGPCILARSGRFSWTKRCTKSTWISWRVSDDGLCGGKTVCIASCLPPLAVIIAHTLYSFTIKTCTLILFSTRYARNKDSIYNHNVDKISDKLVRFTVCVCAGGCLGQSMSHVPVRFGERTPAKDQSESHVSKFGEIRAPGVGAARWHFWGFPMGVKRVAVKQTGTWNK